ncbi:MAG: hypothetical protein F6K49_27515 [Moorea sp. SIO3I6]|nr:hypothetical protein [Moorena sp. SIO3I8]NEP25595.1 hypothetical protein [Moorena sp. SIO3I6]
MVKISFIFTNIKCLLPTTPYSLLPTPYSLLPTPYSLLPTPYSLLPTPYSLTKKIAAEILSTAR